MNDGPKGYLVALCPAGAIILFQAAFRARSIANSVALIAALTALIHMVEAPFGGWLGLGRGGGCHRWKP